MSIVPVGPFDLVDPTPEDVAIAQAAFAAVDPAFPLAELLGIRHRVKFVDSLGARDGKAEGFYPARGKFQVRRMYNRKGSRRAYREQGNFLHESVHGFLLSKAQKAEIVALLGGKYFGSGPEDDPVPYWDRVNEATCDHLVPIMTEGKIRSHYEDDRLPIRADRVDELAEIVTRMPPDTEEPEPVEPEPVDPVIVALTLRAEKAEARVATLENTLDEIHVKSDVKVMT